MPSIKQSNQQDHLNSSEVSAEVINNNEKLSANNECTQLAEKIEHLVQAVNERALELSDKLQRDHNNLLLDLKNIPHLKASTSDQKQELTHEVERLIKAQSEETKQLNLSETNMLKTLADTARNLSDSKDNLLQEIDLSRFADDIRNSINSIARESEANQQELRKSMIATLVDSNLHDLERSEKIREIASQSEQHFQETQQEIFNTQNEILNTLANTNPLSQDATQKIRESLGELGKRLENEAIARLALSDNLMVKQLLSESDVSIARDKRLDELRKNLAWELELTNQQKSNQKFSDWLKTERVRVEADQDSRHARGNTGEVLATDYLIHNGYEIASYKPDIRETTKPGIDIVALKYNNETNKHDLYAIDNKALSRDGNVNTVSALTDNLKVNIEKVRQQFEEIRKNTNTSEAEKITAERVLQAIEEERIILVVTNANIAQDSKILKGVTENLSRKNIKFIDVFKEEIKSKEVQKQLDYRQTISEERRKLLEAQDIAISGQKVIDIKRKEMRTLTEKLANQLEIERNNENRR